MSARDELIELIDRLITVYGVYPRHCDKMADAIQAAGWIDGNRLREKVVDAREDSEGGSFFYAEEPIYDEVLDLIDRALAS